MIVEIEKLEFAEDRDQEALDDARARLEELELHAQLQHKARTQSLKPVSSINERNRLRDGLRLGKTETTDAQGTFP